MPPGSRGPGSGRPDLPVQSIVVTVSTHHVDSEVGRLRTVLLHRPGNELRRLTPRNSADLLFDDIPWVGRAQDEHDAFAAALRERDVEVLYLRDLLVEAIDATDAGPELPGAGRSELVRDAVHFPSVGPTLFQSLRRYLEELPSKDLAEVVVAGMTHDEIPVRAGPVSTMAEPHDFVIPPLPNLLFTRDSSVWVHDQVAVTRLALAARRRESTIMSVIYHGHP